MRCGCQQNVNRVKNVLSHFISFLVGMALGASGQYFASKFTDQRRRQEAKRETQDRFKKAREAVPDLIAEMRDDLRKPEHATTRHFYVR